METMACIEASIFILLSCAWEKLGEEKEKRETQNTWHSQSPHKQSHLTPRLSWGSQWQELPVLQTQPHSSEEIVFSVAGSVLKDNLCDFVQYRAEGRGFEKNSHGYALTIQE